MKHKSSFCVNLYRNAKRAEKITAKFKSFSGYCSCVKMDFGKLLLVNPKGMEVRI